MPKSQLYLFMTSA